MSTQEAEFINDLKLQNQLHTSTILEQDEQIRALTEERDRLKEANKRLVDISERIVVLDNASELLDCLQSMADAVESQAYQLSQAVKEYLSTITPKP